MIAFVKLLFAMASAFHFVFWSYSYPVFERLAPYQPHKPGDAYLPNCRILLMSGNGEATPLLDKAEADGIHCDVLPEPIRPPELIAKLESLLA